MTTRPTRTLSAASLAAVLLLSACGSSDDGDAVDTTEAAAETTAAAASETTAAAEEAAETTAAADTTAAAAETTVATETSAAVADTTPAVAGSADYELVEWAINGSASLAAGSVTFNVTNGGNFPHELVVVKGDSYAALPLASSGAIEVDQLEAGAFIGETERIDPGASGTFTVDLSAGRYVLVCNITGGGSSHAARGQVLEVDVA